MDCKAISLTCFVVDGSYFAHWLSKMFFLSIIATDMTFVSKSKVKLLKIYFLNPQRGTNHKCVYDSPRFYARQTK